MTHIIDLNKIFFKSIIPISAFAYRYYQYVYMNFLLFWNFVLLFPLLP